MTRGIKHSTTLGSRGVGGSGREWKGSGSINVKDGG